MTTEHQKTVALCRFSGSVIALLPNSTAETVAVRFRPGAGIYVSRTGAVCGVFSSEFCQVGHETATDCPRPEGATPNATHQMREALTPLKENPYPYLHSRHNHRFNSCFQPVFGGCEADFVRDGFAVYTRVLAGPCELRNRGSVGLGRTAPAERRTLVRGRRRVRRVHLASLGRVGRCSSPLPARLPRPAAHPSARRAVRACPARLLGLPAFKPVDLLATREVTTWSKR